MTKYNQLQANSNKSKKRVGRGIASGSGKTAGRGTKGQGARSGRKPLSIFQGGQNAVVKAVPKSRGFKSLRTPAQVVYLDRLSGLTGVVDNFKLFEAELIATPFHKVKVITRGEISSKISLKTQSASKSAIEAIKKAGGSFDKTATPIQKSAKTAASSDK